MEFKENIERFGKIVKANNLDLKDVQSVARALVMADRLHFDDVDHGNYEHLTLATVSQGAVPEFRGISNGVRTDKAVTDVMQMRLMCDVLTVLLKEKQPLAMQYSGAVLGRERSQGYLDYETCDGILSAYFDSVGTYDDSLKSMFYQVSDCLGRLKKLGARFEPDGKVLTKDCVKDVWLPDEFDAHGYTVTMKAPREVVSRGSTVRCVECYDFGYIMDAIIKGLAGVCTDETYMYMFLYKIQDLKSVSNGELPVGVGVLNGLRPLVYEPAAFIKNSSVRDFYEQVFSWREVVSARSCDIILDVIERWLDSNKRRGDIRV